MRRGRGWSPKRRSNPSLDGEEVSIRPSAIHPTQHSNQRRRINVQKNSFLDGEARRKRGEDQTSREKEEEEEKEEGEEHFSARARKQFLRFPIGRRNKREKRRGESGRRPAKEEEEEDMEEERKWTIIRRKKQKEERSLLPARRQTEKEERPRVGLARSASTAGFVCWPL